MRLIRALLQPHRLDAVRDALQQQGVRGMTTYQSQGFGRQRGHNEIHRGAEYQISFRPKITVEIVLDDKQVDAVVESIIRSSRTGNNRRRQDFHPSCRGGVRIRTGESGDQALQRSDGEVQRVQTGSRPPRLRLDSQEARPPASLSNFGVITPCRFLAVIIIYSTQDCASGRRGKFTRAAGGSFPA